MILQIFCDMVSDNERPKVVKTVTGEDVSQENLGGASVHSTKSGVTHFTAQTEEEGLALIRKLLSYIPQNNLEEAPYVDCTDPIDRLEDSLNDIIPDSPNKPYDTYGLTVETCETDNDVLCIVLLDFEEFAAVYDRTDYFVHIGPLCRWCRLFSGSDRLHADDGRYFLYVPHRTESCENRYR